MPLEVSGRDPGGRVSPAGRYSVRVERPTDVCGPSVNRNVQRVHESILLRGSSCGRDRRCAGQDDTVTKRVRSSKDHVRAGARVHTSTRRYPSRQSESFKSWVNITLIVSGRLVRRPPRCSWAVAARARAETGPLGAAEAAGGRCHPSSRVAGLVAGGSGRRDRVHDLCEPLGRCELGGHPFNGVRPPSDAANEVCAVIPDQ